MLYPRIFDKNIVESWFFTKKDFLNQWNIDYDSFAHCHQIHSDILLKAKSLWEQGNCDAIWTDEIWLKCWVYTADCIPILFHIKNLYFEKQIKNIVWVIHSGWKWTVKNIVYKTFEKLRTMSGLDKTSFYSSVYIWIGPCICAKCYEFWSEAINIFNSKYLHSISNWKYLVDIKSQVIDQMLSLWILYKNIEDSQICSFENEELCFSYRRNKDKSRMYAWIMLK